MTLFTSAKEQVNLLRFPNTGHIDAVLEFAMMVPSRYTVSLFLLDSLVRRFCADSPRDSGFPPEAQVVHSQTGVSNGWRHGITSIYWYRRSRR
jgi:hypothetical protein